MARMILSSNLDGRAAEFRIRGPAWELNSLTFREFLYLIPNGDRGNGRYRVIEAEGENLWELLTALGDQVSSACGVAVKRLDARAVGAPAGAERPHSPSTRSSSAPSDPAGR
jgi:hypothetical protein